MALFLYNRPTGELARPVSKRLAIRRIVWVALIVGGIALFFLPIELPYTISTQGRVGPEREWTLARGTDGHLSASLYNHKLGLTEQYVVAQFEREDAIQFTLNSTVLDQPFIQAGDTIGAVLSSETDRERTRLTGELAEQRATLRLFESGEKSSVIEEAERVLLRAEARVDEQQRIVNRLQTLRDRDVTSEQELEVAESRLRIYEHEVDIARAQLERVQTGAKPAQLDLIRSRIQSLNAELNALSRRTDHFTLVSPISGNLLTQTGPDTLVAIADAAAMVVFMPIPWSKRIYINEGQDIQISSPHLEQPFMATLERVDQRARTVGSNPYVLAVARLEPASHNHVVPGMIVDCKIPTPSVSISEYIRRTLKSSLGQP